MKLAHSKKLLILVVLISTGILLEVAGLLDAATILGHARGYADSWWLALVLVLLQILMFTFALAGSFFLWIAAPLFPPATAALILAAGGTLGGVGAYWFSNKLSAEWRLRIENSHAYQLLHKQSNFFTLFALRVFPAFPHSLINYSSGMLQVRLSHFIVAAILGIYIKSYVYAQVIYKATTTASFAELLDFWTLAPLIGLAVISLLAVFIKHRLSAGRSQS